MSDSKTTQNNLEKITKERDELKRRLKNVDHYVNTHMTLGRYGEPSPDKTQLRRLLNGFNPPKPTTTTNH